MFTLKENKFFFVLVAIIIALELPFLPFKFMRLLRISKKYLK